MGLFGKKRSDEEVLEETTGKVESATGSSELKDLISEFRQMRSSIKEDVEDEVDDVDDLSELGEEYELSEDESQSIEDFLNASDVDEEEIVEEEYSEDEEIEEEYSEDEEIYDEESESDEDEFYVAEDQYEEIEDEEEVEDDDFVEDENPVDVEVSINEYVEDEEPFAPTSEKSDVVTSEELNKKFDEFENRLLEKLMKQFAQMQAVQPAEAKEEPVPQVVSVSASEDEDLEISSEDGKLVINGYTYTGEVVMFTPIESLKKASWEDVVRRKGHCTYHLTTSGNGGWFIKKSNAPNPYAYIQNKEDAEQLAMVYAKREKAELKIHNAKGVIEKSLSFGREKLRG